MRIYFSLCQQPNLQRIKGLLGLVLDRERAEKKNLWRPFRLPFESLLLLHPSWNAPCTRGFAFFCGHYQGRHIVECSSENGHGRVEGCVEGVHIHRGPEEDDGVREAQPWEEPGRRCPSNKALTLVYPSLHKKY